MAKQVFAVVHVTTPLQAYTNVRIAEDTGCDGAFLITHGDVDTSTLWEVYFRMRRTSHLLLGINLLNVPTAVCMSEASTRGQREGLRVHMLWADNYKKTHMGADNQCGMVREFQQRVHQEHLKYFGGVAFKYQPEEHLRGEALALETTKAMEYVDVLTTSGTDTGAAPDLAKIKTMREAMGPAGQLAIASGITAENVEQFAPYADYFLVSTGISKDFYNLDPMKTHQLVSRVR